MKTLVLFTLMFYASSFLRAQQNTEIQFDKYNHNFGEIKEENGPVGIEFKFTNTGKHDFLIEKVDVSCGCTAPAYTREAVKPGKTGFIRATYDTKNKDGDFVETLTISGNLNAKIQLKIMGKVVPRPRTALDDYPAAMGSLRFKVNHVVMGDVTRNSYDTGYIYLLNSGSKTITIKNITAPEHIRTTQTPIIIQPNEKKTIEVFFSAYHKKELGYSFDRIYLITDDAAYEDKEIIVVANIVNNYMEMNDEDLKNAPKIEFKSTTHNFGVLKQGSIVFTEFEFTNSGKDQLVIYDTKTNCGCTASTLNKMKFNPGESSVIKVTLDTKGKDGYIQQSVNVKTNDPSNPEVFLILNAKVEKQ